MSLIHRRLGAGMVVKGYASAVFAFALLGWHKVLRLDSRIWKKKS